MHAIRSRLLAQSLPPLIPAPANSFCRSISRRVQSLPSQPLRPVLPTPTYPSTNLNSHNARTMASSSAPLQEWLVIAPDFDGALEKRLAVRPQHIDGLKADPDTFWLWGGAMLEEPIKEGDAGPPKMKGSAMLIGAKTREEVIERLKKDVYVQGGVWDLEKVQIIPFKSALRKAL
ncbi:hypothetical protein BS50DRAFT_576564 [Corynespora cassiicola Philippines]|uniref:YCII-related domain-containing protein n=1 Tax=Corynespora cassiicola Philippines TaxID=1448308 RepID=A0A2T2NER3_CORCC|nr:hypothetical protein BS50DRAFT_576564 [Corynespora cassiicola Philippines]